MGEASAVFAAGISALALVVAAVSAVYAYRQARASERQAKANEAAVRIQAEALKSQADDTARALAVAERNAGAAEQSAKMAADHIVQAKEATIRRLRPYVTIDEITAKELLTCVRGNVPREVTIRVINSGQTPASHLEILYRAAVLTAIPQSFDEHAQQFRTWMPTDIGSGQTRQVYGQPIARDEILGKATDDPTFNFLVYGCIKYSAVLNNDEYITGFCFVWNIRLEEFFPVGPMNSLT